MTGDSLLDTVGIRELAANVSGVVAGVASSGLPAVVTKHGEPVAALIPIADLRDLLAARAERQSLETPRDAHGGGPSA